MTRPRQTGSRIDADGVRTFEVAHSNRRIHLALVACGLAVAVAVATVALRRQSEPGTAARDDLAARQSAAAPADTGSPAHEPVSSPRRIRAVHIDQIAPLSSTEPETAGDAARAEEPELDAREVIAALAAAGEKEGIAAFPPPGTDPIKRGIIVPDDFELPEGYARHYQATDGGERVAAILMFSPDYRFFDDAGEPIALPEDRIVPRELAPAGMPIRMLKAPKRRSAGQRAP